MEMSTTNKEVIYMNYKELLYNKDKSLTFYPELAVILNKFDEIESKRISEETGTLKKPDKTGLNKAIFLNQLNYWIELNEKAGINFKDGHYWMYSSYSKMIERDFPYWSVDTIKRAVTSLERYGIVVSGNYNSLKIDKKKWYRIDYKRLQEVIDIVKQNDELAEFDENAVCADDGAKCTDDECNVSRAIEENRNNKDYSKDNINQDFILPNKEKKTLSVDKGVNTSSPSVNITTIPPRTREQKEERRKQIQNSCSLNYKDEHLPVILSNEFESLYGDKEDIFKDHDICLTMALICNFFKKFKQFRGERHPIVFEKDVDQFLHMVQSTDSDMAKDEMIEEDEELDYYLDMMDEFFGTDIGQNNKLECDYHIWLFFTEKTQNILYNRVKQKREEQEE